MNERPEDSPGTLFVVTAPSGAGKTTLVRGLLERSPGLRLSVSHTTRSPRAGEEHGREYHFVDVATFQRLRAAGEFLEWAEVHGNYYGTSRGWLAGQAGEGHDVVLEIDWQGARLVRRVFPDAVGVFVLPPSLAELERRLRGRGADSEESIARRLAAARGEMSHVSEFAYVIINERLSAAIDDMAAIVRAARLRHACQRKRHSRYFASFAQD
ncbi:MAG: guanylate kinase [Azoarcus sp.]|jgi:guanylate kinase|nr:guanylate kinase [Azoarcus sp.]